MKSYSASEVAGWIVGDSMIDPEGWLVRQIKSGRVAAMKVGRKYRFTEEQAQAAVESLTVGERLRPKSDPIVAVGRPSPASMRRRIA